MVSLYGIMLEEDTSFTRLHRQYHLPEWQKCIRSLAKMVNRILCRYVARPALSSNKAVCTMHAR